MPGTLTYIPVVHPMVARDPDGKLVITREWLHQQQTLTDLVFAAGDVFGPPSAGAAGNIVIFANTTGKQIADGGFTILQVIAEAKKTFAHTFMLMGAANG